jgi:predicted Zn-dependent protease
MPMKLEKRHAFPLTLAPIMLALGFVLFKLYTASKVVNPETGRVARVGLNPEQELRLGLEAYAQVQKDEASKIIQSGYEVDLVKRVTNKLAKAAAVKATVHYNWEVIIFNLMNYFFLM